MELLERFDTLKWSRVLRVIDDGDQIVEVHEIAKDIIEAKECLLDSAQEIGIESRIVFDPKQF